MISPAGVGCKPCRAALWKRHFEVLTHNRHVFGRRVLRALEFTLIVRPVHGPPRFQGTVAFALQPRMFSRHIPKLHDLNGRRPDDALSNPFPVRHDVEVPHRRRYQAVQLEEPEGWRGCAFAPGEHKPGACVRIELVVAEVPGRRNWRHTWPAGLRQIICPEVGN